MVYGLESLEGLFINGLEGLGGLEGLD